MCLRPDGVPLTGELAYVKGLPFRARPRSFVAAPNEGGRTRPLKPAELIGIAGYVSPVQLARPVGMARRSAIPTAVIVVTLPASWDARR